MLPSLEEKYQKEISNPVFYESRPNKERIKKYTFIISYPYIRFNFILNFGQGFRAEYLKIPIGIYIFLNERLQIEGGELTAYI